MLFNYKIKIEVVAEFEAPLLGADTTGFRRKMTDQVLPSLLKDMFKKKEIEMLKEVDNNLTLLIKINKEVRGAKDKLT